MSQEIRLALPSEFEQIHQLILEHMDPEFSYELFKWKHLDNPNGKSICIVFLEDHNIIGFNFYGHHIIEVGGINYKFLRSSESLVLPSGRGKGVFSRIQDFFNTNYDGTYAGYFGTPNSNSFDIFRKRGWSNFKIETSFLINIPLGRSSKVFFFRI
jgi:hypothetical protein